MVAEDGLLRFREESHGPELLVNAEQVVELWYDYNPCGWQHANNWRLVYLSGGNRKSVDVFDQADLKEPFRTWLTRNFPASVSEKFERQFGWPGGEQESELVWKRETEPGS